jgi:hypothetical protein
VKSSRKDFWSSRSTHRWDHHGHWLAHDGFTQLRNDENLLNFDLSLDDLIDWTKWSQATTEESSSCEGLDVVLNRDDGNLHSQRGDSRLVSHSSRSDAAFTGTTSDHLANGWWSRVNARPTPAEGFTSAASPLLNLSSFSVIFTRRGNNSSRTRRENFVCCDQWVKITRRLSFSITSKRHTIKLAATNSKACAD